MSDSVNKNTDAKASTNSQSNDSSSSNSKSSAIPLVNGKNSFRRVKTRSARACEVCHARKVRCDVMVHMPCTNCAAFGVECRIPEVKRRRATKKGKKQDNKDDESSTWQDSKSKSDNAESDNAPTAATKPVPTNNNQNPILESSKEPPVSSRPFETSSTVNNTTTTSKASDKTSSPVAPEESSHASSIAAQPHLSGPERPYSNTHITHDANPNQSTRSTTLSYLLQAASLHDSGRVAFLGSSSNMSLLLEPQGADTYHFPLPEEISGSSSRLSEMDNEEIEILKFRGAFLLPPRDLCDDIVESYFEKIHPTIPLVNRTQFMRRYNDPSNPPSLLLLQAILLAGSRVCRNEALLDSAGSSELASLTFYKRVKALYDANYETDRIAIVQSLVLMGWWWEGPEDVTRNSFYWTRVALSVAQGFGLHRSVEKTSMALIDKRMWKRIWWSLFLRDRWAAVALGRPVQINLEDSDVPMITEDDFIEDEPGMPSPYPRNRIHCLYFIHAVKLSEIMGFVLRQHFSVDAENMKRRNKVPSVSHCDMAMVSWMQNLPEELKYKVKDTSNHNFFKALLHAQYYTILCLVHRSNILHETNTNSPYPSWGIAFQAAHMIAKIMENMLDYDEPRDCPAFFVYTLFSAMIMLIYQTESPIPAIVTSARKALAICFNALKEMGKTWLVGRMILKLFHQLNENKSLRDHFVRSSRGSVSSKKHSKKRDQRQSTKKNPPNTAMDPPVIAVSTPDTSMNQTVPNAFPDADTNKRKQDLANEEMYPNKATRSDTGNENEAHPSAPILSSNVPASHHTDNINVEAPWPASNINNPPIPNVTSADATIPHPTDDTVPPSHIVDSNINSYSLFDATSPNTAVHITSPDFGFVTNAPPQGQNFYENFQPSQLFPEPQDSSKGGVNDDFLLGSSGSLSGFIFGQNNKANNNNNNNSNLGSNFSGNNPPNLGPNRNLASMNNPNPLDGRINSSVSPGDYTSSNDSKSSPVDEISGTHATAPNSLNLGDWYTYLVSTFTGTDDIAGSPGSPSHNFQNGVNFSMPSSSANPSKLSTRTHNPINSNSHPNNNDTTSQPIMNNDNNNNQLGGTNEGNKHDLDNQNKELRSDVGINEGQQGNANTIEPEDNSNK